MYKILIDSREQRPYEFAGRQVEVKGLKTGDYSVDYDGEDLSHKVAIERKSLDDFVGSITTNRERFVKELERAKDLEFFAIVIEGSWDDIDAHRYTSLASPKSITGTILSWTVKYNIPIILAGTRQRAEQIVVNYLDAYLRYKSIKKERIISDDVVTITPI